MERVFRGVPTAKQLADAFPGGSSKKIYFYFRRRTRGKLSKFSYIFYGVRNFANADKTVTAPNSSFQAFGLLTLVGIL